MNEMIKVLRAYPVKADHLTQRESEDQVSSNDPPVIRHELNLLLAQPPRVLMMQVGFQH